MAVSWIIGPGVAHRPYSLPPAIVAPDRRGHGFSDLTVQVELLGRFGCVVWPAEGCWRVMIAGEAKRGVPLPPAGVRGTPALLQQPSGGVPVEPVTAHTEPRISPSPPAIPTHPDRVPGGQRRHTARPDISE